MMVITTDKPTRTIVKRRYLPRRGSARDVDGIISEIKRKNIVWERRMDMHKAIFSPESAGR